MYEDENCAAKIGHLERIDFYKKNIRILTNSDAFGNDFKEL